MDLTADRRILRTKSAIREALISLTAEKGFDALSVKDIATRANINRGTFYLHYQDKFDLLEQTLEEITRDIETILMRLTTLAPKDFTNGQALFQIVVSLFEYFDRNSGLMQAILETKANFTLQTKIRKIMQKNLFEKNSAALIKPEKLMVPGEYFTSYVSSAHFGVFQEWLETGRRETPEQMARILMNLSLRGPLAAAGLIS